MDSMEEDLTELKRQANQMHEMQLEIHRIVTMTSQAEERAKVGEEKACDWHGQGPRPKEGQTQQP